jgi:hypothetical protein
VARRPEEDAPLPALTSAEAALLDQYLAAVDSLARINPARAQHVYGALRSAQALVAQAKELRDALTLMFERGEVEVHSATLGRALRVLGADRRVAQLTIPD